MGFQLFIHTIDVLIFRLDWPVRTLSFSHDGQLLASASEDLIIDIAEVETGQFLTSNNNRCFNSRNLYRIENSWYRRLFKKMQMDEI